MPLVLVLTICALFFPWRHAQYHRILSQLGLVPAHPGVVQVYLTTLIPEVIVHSQSQDEEQVCGRYDSGGDFYSWFLGPRMIYTSGIIGDINAEETLEQQPASNAVHRRSRRPPSSTPTPLRHHQRRPRCALRQRHWRRQPQCERRRKRKREWWWKWNRQRE